MSSRAPGAGRLLVQRGRTQAALVFAVWGVLVVCATLVGLGAVLVTAGSDRALSASLADVDGERGSGSPDLSSVIVATNTLAGGQPLAADHAVDVTRSALLAAAGQYDATVSIWAATPLLFIPGDSVRKAYLLDADTATENGALLAGAWPAATGASTPLQVAIPSTAAVALGLGVGSELRLTEHRSGVDDPTSGGFTVIVAGIFEPNQSQEWDRDPLRGEGYVPNYDRVPAYGPFLVPTGTLVDSATPVERVNAVLDPDLRGDPSGIPAMTRALDQVSEQIGAQLGDSIKWAVVHSEIAWTYAGMRTELSLTVALVLTALIVLLAVGMATVSLVAQVLVRRRGVETLLLRDRGAATRQLGLRASAEALVLAAAATAVSVPLVMWSFRAIAGWTALGESWATAPRTASPLGGALLPAVALGAIVPASLLVAAALPRGARLAHGRLALRGTAAQSGIDVLLALVAAGAFLQLRSHVISPGAIDPVLVVAPAVCLIAGSLLAARLIPVAARAAENLARRGRGIIVPLASWHVARGGAARGTFVAVAATALAILGTTFLATWSQSQADQAEAIVGADVVVHQSGGAAMGATLNPGAGTSAAPVASRAIVLGTRPEGSRLIALDSARAGELIRGRLPDGGSWAALMASLAPPDTGSGFSVHGASVTIKVTGERRPDPARGGATVDADLVATPTVALEDAWGSVTILGGTPVALDGAAHTMTLPAAGQAELPDGDWTVVSIDFRVEQHSEDPFVGSNPGKGSAEISVDVLGASAGGGDWHATTDDGQAQLRAPLVEVNGATVRARFSYAIAGLAWQDGNVRLLAFEPPADVPVVMTQAAADGLALVAGDRISMTVASNVVTARVAGTMPYVPGHVHSDGVLADMENLTRAMLAEGQTSTVTDEWWVATDDEGLPQALRDQNIGPVESVSETATTLLMGPLRVPLRVAWVLAVAAAMALAIAGAAAHAAAEAQVRAPTIARVRGLGVARRTALASHFLQHAFVTVGAVAAGSVVGGVLAALLAPLLVVAPRGERAIPEPVLAFPLGAAGVAVGLVLLGSLAAGIPAARAVVRRSTVSVMRAGEFS